MPTLEELEERLEALERILSATRAERTPDARELEERVNEQIRALQQQQAEQQRRLSSQEQGMSALTRALTHQFNAINARFDVQDTNINARFDAQTAAIRAQFENTNMPLTRIVGMVDRQEKDIREMKEHLARVDQRMESGFEAVDQRFELVATNQQVEEVRQDMNSRFDQVLQQLAAITMKLD
jgi:hypothetical protein